MELLKERILKEGSVKAGNILKVDSFLNHQLDIGLFHDIGKEFKRLFANDGVNKILTLEASGIGIAVITALHFDYCPVIFAKKTQSKNLDGDLFIAQVTSFTRGLTYDIQVAKKYILSGDRILIVDDFLATGSALLGMAEIVEQSEAVLVGCGIVIEKGFQEGGTLLRDKGVRVESLAIIKAFDGDQVIFEN
ncbi:MAG: xanthine phosphoribosyltransferase [Peptococcaceae bacterium]|jgi:xanthine phosphoribosyltransferase|nr:xanthine phosphoribosyltransferase [Peptococcaceae bacterium]